MSYGVLGSNLTGAHVIEGCLTDLYNMKFLENELLLHFEDVQLPTRGQSGYNTTQYHCIRPQQ
jgi:hypothetical protein